jgi:TolA-binding protein
METAQQQPQRDDSALRELVANDRQQIESLQQQVAQQNDRLAELEHNGPNSPGPSSSSLAGTGQAALPSPAASPDESMGNAASATPPGPSESGPGAEASPGNGADQQATDQSDTGAANGESPSGNGADQSGASSSAELASAAPPAPPAPEAAPRPTELPSWQDEARQQLATTQNGAGAKLYRAGLADLTGGRYAQGVAKLQDLQHRYPKSNLSEPAEYFTGNALYELGQNEKAILQFNDLTMRFPEGKYSSAALLHEAQAFTKINDPIDARLTLQKLLNDHPSAPEAPTAKSMMASLSS